MWKTRPWQAVDSLQVFNWLQFKFPNLKFKRHTNFVAPDIEYGNIGSSITDEYNKQVSGDNIQQRAFAEYVCHIENCDAYYTNVATGGYDAEGINCGSGELEELYYLSAITENNFRKHHYNILITELPENFKDATCIKMKLTNIDILLGFTEGFNNGDDDNVYIPLYYLLNNHITTWIELIYYTNKLLNEYLAINNIVLNINFFPLYRFETIIENGYKVIVPFFEEPNQYQ
jgi:hypothetical protein